MSGAKASPPELGSEAGRLFAQYLESLDTVEEQDFDELCAAHPAQEADLRALRAAWRADEPGASPPGPGISFFRRGSETVAPPLPGVEPGRVIGDFRILSYIGGGGMGQVWEAEELTLGRRVALKLVLPGRVDPHRLELFAREARAGGRLAHPGIVRVHGFGQTDGVHWINEELIAGGWTLRDFIDEMRNAESLPEGYYRRVAQFAIQLADALQAAHDAGVIHRDVKPQNVLITPEDQPKLTDFGLARITDESVVSVTGEFAGTYLYMSPEQVTARRMGIDHRTDVFSLGVVLYEMLALQRPFEGDTTHQIAEKIVTWDPPDLHRLRSRIPVELAVICGKALEKRRDERYPTMAELVADLRRHLANEPIMARRAGPIRRAQKWALRNPTKSVAGGIAVAAFAVISGLGLHISEQKDDLESARENAENQLLQLELGSVSNALLWAMIDESWSPEDEDMPSLDQLLRPNPRGFSYLPGEGTHIDRWGSVYRISAANASGSWVVRSDGPDGIADTSDDIEYEDKMIKDLFGEISSRKEREIRPLIVKTEMTRLRLLAEGFQIENRGKTPTQENVIARGFLNEWPRDPWGTPYRLLTEGEKLDIASNGPDGLPDTEDDILCSDSSEED